MCPCFCLQALAALANTLMERESLTGEELRELLEAQGELAAGCITHPPHNHLAPPTRAGAEHLSNAERTAWAVLAG